MVILKSRYKPDARWENSVKKIASCYKDDYTCNGSLVRYFLKINIFRM